MSVHSHWKAIGLIPLVLALVLTPTGAEAQERSAWLAARQCEVKVEESQALNEAFTEFVEYAIANPAGLPGAVYGSFRQRVWGGAHFTTLYEVASIGEWEERQRGRRQLMANDARWGQLWQALTSHLVPGSCETSFHQRWPVG